MEEWRQWCALPAVRHIIGAKIPDGLDACAIGEIDAEALFFLRSRGLDEATARQLLIGGFIEQVLGHCDDPVIADVLRGHIEHKIAALMGGKTERRDEF